MTTLLKGINNGRRRVIDATGFNHPDIVVGRPRTSWQGRDRKRRRNLILQIQNDAKSSNGSSSRIWSRNMMWLICTLTDLGRQCHHSLHHRPTKCGCQPGSRRSKCTRSRECEVDRGLGLLETRNRYRTRGELGLATGSLCEDVGFSRKQDTLIHVHDAAEKDLEV